MLFLLRCRFGPPGFIPPFPLCVCDTFPPGCSHLPPRACLTCGGRRCWHSLTAPTKLPTDLRNLGVNLSQRMLIPN
jgi:hypothetical protein